MGIGDMLQAQVDAEDAARYRYIVRNRCWHMLKLLDEGKGDDKAFHKMVDRCIASEAKIREDMQQSGKTGPGKPDAR